MSEQAGILPWHEATWQRVAEQIAADRLPHGLLVTGPADSGKRRLVDQLARHLLCKGEVPACGTCPQCRLMEAGTHPDLKEVGLEESKQIRVEQIRDLIEWAMHTAQQGGRKLCIIDPADKMNQQSANALLKVLEEPPANTVICLVTSRPSRLLPTLRSRCQKIECVLPDREQAVTWLAEEKGGDAEKLLGITGGNPLRALRTIDDEYLARRIEIADIMASHTDPLAAAAQLAGTDPDRVLEIIYQLLSDSIVMTMTDGERPQEQDLKDELSALTKLALSERYDLLDRATEARGLIAGTANPNVQMLFEWVLLGGDGSSVRL